jgi:4-hydroxybenzoate polyprenyltransferase
MRELPRGTLTVGQARASVVIASLVFVFAAWQINALCFALSPLALLWVLGYSYTKRFTRWSHLWLGLGLSIAPVGGYLAITGTWSEPWWQIGVLALAVVAWSGGFDTLYALQDAEFDRKNGLHSLPAAIGVRNAITVARLLHVFAVICLSVVVASNPLALGPAEQTARLVLWLGVAFVAAMLVWEHRLVRVDDLSKLDAAFFTMNGIISLGFLGAVFVARLLADPDIVVSMRGSGVAP